MWRRNSRTRDPLPRRNENHINSAQFISHSDIYSLVFACETRDRICQSGKLFSGPSSLRRLDSNSFPTRTRKHVDRAKGHSSSFSQPLTYELSFLRIIMRKCHFCASVSFPFILYYFHNLTKWHFLRLAWALQVTQII